ncbi:SDR family oxidoreductase [Agromyces archimandritae]|uniref:SDR family oxidoreductase n=1 Tax=Agromyces archimandritae TaxID=2781962 RepID=A0A975FMP2_9MICO|nr:SDR family oxidoreductase [Agromyces archimandritae]QTX03826.1 SDR family oxidoreductase [Agromyces archimandritae]
MRIAVAGGTGTIGAHAVDAARAAGHDTVVLARSAGVDLMSGAGLDEALEGVYAVIDTSNLKTLSERAASEFFTTASCRLLAAEGRHGVGHHVALSIVGIDRAPYGYYEAKLAQEHVIEAGDRPWTILRATQFHEFAEQMLAGYGFAGIHFAPKARSQPVAAREVGERLVALAAADAVGHARDLAGPREEQIDDMVRRLAKAKGLRGPVVGVSLPGKQYRAMREGAVLPGPDADLGTQTFEEWLGEAVPAR